MSFQADTAVHADGDGFIGNLPPAWGIWGPNGGFMAAVCLRASAARVAVGQRPVTLSVQYLGRPAFGDVDLRVDTVKPGSTACHNIVLAQGGVTLLQAQLWTTSRNQGPDVATAVMPDIPGPAGLENLRDYKARRGETEHPFWQNLEARPIGFASAPDADTPDPGLQPNMLRQWTRFQGWQPTDDVFLDAGRAALLIDTLVWPAHARGRGSSGPGPDYVAPSLDLTVWFHQAAGPADWLLADVHADTAGQGLIHGAARVWSDDGRLIATGGSQLLVVPPR